MKNIIYPVIASLLFLTSCNGTWIMYDTDQNDHIYFQDRQQVLIKSFALLADDEIDVEAPVCIMGTVRTRTGLSSWRASRVRRATR